MTGVLTGAAVVVGLLFVFVGLAVAVVAGVRYVGQAIDAATELPAPTPSDERGRHRV